MDLVFTLWAWGGGVILFSVCGVFDTDVWADGGLVWLMNEYSSTSFVKHRQHLALKAISTV